MKRILLLGLDNLSLLAGAVARSGNVVESRVIEPPPCIKEVVRPVDHAFNQHNQAIRRRLARDESQKRMQRINAKQR